MPFPTQHQIEQGNYPKWEGNTPFERECLKAIGLPEDYHPTEDEAYRIMMAAIEE